MRWLVLIALGYSVLRAYTGYIQLKAFTTGANQLRHWTATIAHLQLVVGLLVYTQSPVAQYFMKNIGTAIQNPELIFFGLIHLVLMLVAIVVITIGSALAKRRDTDTEKYKTMLIWFGIALLIILVAIPWPFSPLAARPYIRLY